MKKILLVLCCSILFFPAMAQLPYIGTPTVIPQNPTASSFIKVVTNVTTPNQGIVVDVPTYTVAGQHIYIKSCYWQGMLTATQNYVDTLMIGQLPSANYVIHQVAYMSSTQQHCSIIDSNRVTTQLEVPGVATSIAKGLYVDHYKIYFDPVSETLNFQGSQVSEEAFIFSANGALVRKIRLEENKPVAIADLANGLYFVRLSDKNKAVKFIKYGG